MPLLCLGVAVPAPANAGGGWRRIPPSTSGCGCAVKSGIEYRRVCRVTTGLQPWRRSDRCAIFQAKAQSHGPEPDVPEGEEPTWSPDFDNIDFGDEYYHGLDHGEEDDMDDLLEVDPNTHTLSPAEMQAIFNDPDFRLGGKAAGPQPVEDMPLPEVVLVAGLRAEELPVIRVLMDRLGWVETRLVPVTNGMLHRPASAALLQPEPRWDLPRGGSWQGGSVGAERILLFSGLSVGYQANLVEVLEQSGLPAVSVAQLQEGNGDTLLGELLVQAVRTQRDARRVAGKSLLTEAPQVLRELGDVEEAIREGSRREEVHGTGGLARPEAAKREEVELETVGGRHQEDSGVRSSNGKVQATGGSEQGSRSAADIDASTAEGEALSPAVHHGEEGNAIDDLIALMPVEALAEDEALPSINVVAGDGDNDDGDIHFGVAEPRELLKEKIEQAKRSGVTAAQLKALLGGAAKAQTKASSAEEVMDVPEAVKALLTYEGKGLGAPGAGTEATPQPGGNRPATAEKRPSTVSKLKAVLKQAAAAGVGQEELKGMLAEAREAARK